MVGVKGGSKGCHTCRQKRVSCDQATPSCLRCIKAGIECGGYSRRIRFVHENHRIERVVQRAALRDGGSGAPGIPTLSSSSSSGDFASSSPLEEGDSSVTAKAAGPGNQILITVTRVKPGPQHAPHVTGRDATASQGSSQALTIQTSLIPSRRLKPPAPPPFLSISPFAPTIHLTHLLTHLLLSPKYNGMRGWLTVHLESRGVNPSLEISLKNAAAPTGDTLSPALSCLSTAYFGLTHGVPELVQKAERSYGLALSQLRSDLHDPQKVWRFETLAAASVLGLYEMVVATTRSGYDHHAMGLAHLVQRRGVHRFCTGAAQVWFHENRCLLAAVFIRCRKATFLEQREWKELPWANCPERKTHAQFLGDHLSDIPRVLEDLDTLKALGLTSAPSHPAHKRLLLRVVECLVGLDGWWDVWVRDNTADGKTKLVGQKGEECLVYPTVPTTRSPTEKEGESVFQKVLYYPAAHLANEACVYAAARICLLHAARGLSSNDPVRAREALRAAGPGYWSEALTDGELPGRSLDMQHLAMCICRSVEFHLLGEWGSVGALYLLFPASVALVWGLERGGREQRWLEGVMGLAAYRKGLKLAGELEGRVEEFGGGGVV